MLLSISVLVTETGTGTDSRLLSIRGTDHWYRYWYFSRLLSISGAYHWYRYWYWAAVYLTGRGNPKAAPLSPSWVALAGVVGCRGCGNTPAHLLSRQHSEGGPEGLPWRALDRNPRESPKGPPLCLPAELPELRL